MSPVDTLHYHFYHRMTDTMLFGKSSIANAIFAIIKQNVLDLFFCEFMLSVLFATRSKFIFGRMLIIFKRSNPFQIVNNIVKLISIFMIDLCVYLSGWIKKMLCYQSMNSMPFRDSIFCQGNTSVAINQPADHDMPSFTAGSRKDSANSSVVTNLIDFFISLYWFPILSHGYSYV